MVDFGKLNEAAGITSGDLAGGVPAAEDTARVAEPGTFLNFFVDRSEGPVDESKVTTFLSTAFGEPVLVKCRLKSGYLSFVHLSRATSNAGRERLDVRASFADVRLGLRVIIGGEELTVTELLHGMYQEGSGQEIELSEFRTRLDAMGLKLAAPRGLFIQHMAVPIAKYEEAERWLLNHGAIDESAQLRKGTTFKRRLHLPENTVLLDSLQVGSVDKSQVRTGQGFTDWLTSIVETYSRVTKGWTAIAAKTTQADATEDVEEQRELRREISDIRRSITGSSISSWGGGQLGQADGVDRWYPVNVPCGRFTVSVPADEVHGHTLDFWAPRGGVPDAPSSVVDTTSLPADDEEPF